MKEQYGAQVQFDIVGFFEDEYKAAIEKLTEDGVITFHGFQTDPKPYYAMSHCVVLPSYHEGMSNVLLEAAATGRALITTNIPGCREAVEEGVNGYLCKKQDADDLFASMERFVSLQTEQREAMGISGRRRMEREFDKTAVVQKTIGAILEGSSVNAKL